MHEIALEGSLVQETCCVLESRFAFARGSWNSNLLTKSWIVKIGRMRERKVRMCCIYGMGLFRVDDV
jgi:hypothetical protein